MLKYFEFELTKLGAVVRKIWLDFLDSWVKSVGYGGTNSLIYQDQNL